RDAFDEIYKEIGSHGIRFSALRDKWQAAYVQHKLAHLTRQNANAETIFEAVRQLVNSVSSGLPLEFDVRRLNVSGNLDGALIRQMCATYGILYTPPKTARGGADLEVVRIHRNALAHGTISFSELGKDYVSRDLRQIKARASVFLVGFVRSCESFRGNKLY